MKPDFITIGEIVAPHGCRGAVRVLPHTDFPERFFRMTQVTLLIKGQRKSYPVEQAREHKKRFILLKLSGINTMNEAETLRGALIQVPRSETVPLPPDHYYIFEIIGLKVWSEEGGFLGEVKAVLQTGANDVYSIATPNGKEILIPALKEVVREVNIANGKMVVRLPAGLL